MKKSYKNVYGTKEYDKFLAGTEIYELSDGFFT